MSNNAPLSPKADALAKQLKDSLAQRRPQPWRFILIVLGASILGLVLLAYWLYPRPRPEPLQMLALDVICNRDDTPEARAQLFLPPKDEQPRPLLGHKIVFHEQRLLLKPDAKPREVIATTDAQGQASADWLLPKAEVSEFLANYIDEEEQLNQPAVGRIFVWAKDAPLLAVDVDALLSEHEVDAKASATLMQAAKEGWKVCYLALASGQMQEFRKSRGWLGANQAKLPLGPLLGKPHFLDAVSAGDARRAALKSLGERFTGPMLAITKNAEAATISKAAGVPTILVGAGPAPAEVVHAPTWGDVVLRRK